jgi:hypothetical protein
MGVRRAAAEASKTPALAAALVVPLTEALRADADQYVRGHAAIALRHVASPGEPVREALRAALADPAGFPRVEAAAALLRLTPDAEEPATVIVAAVQGKDRVARDAAVRHVGRLGARARPAVPALALLAGKSKLQSHYRDESWYAVHALAELGPEARAAVPALLAKLGEDWANPNWTAKETGYVDPETCLATVALARIGSAALPDLLRTAREGKDGKQRMHALLAVGFMGPAAQEALPVLEAMLQEQLDPKRKPQQEDAQLRAALRLAIGNIRKADARPPEIRSDED